MSHTRFWPVAALVVVLGVAAPRPAAAAARSRNAAMWWSLLHPGPSEWYLKGWGSFQRNCPKKKFYLGFIPIYGWPGYLQVISAIDARHGRTDDGLSPGEQ